MRRFIQLQSRSRPRAYQALYSRDMAEAPSPSVRPPTRPELLRLIHGRPGARRGCIPGEVFSRAHTRDQLQGRPRRLQELAVADHEVRSSLICSAPRSSSPQTLVLDCAVRKIPEKASKRPSTTRVAVGGAIADDMLRSSTRTDREADLPRSILLSASSKATTMMRFARPTQRR